MELCKNENIFLSYAWGGESEQIVDELYKKLIKLKFNVIRDKINLGYKGNIKTFMQKIGLGDYIIIVISDKYLKSPNCMYEIVQIKKRENLYKRIYPIVLPDADIYNPVKRIQYISYWEKQVSNLNEAMKELTDMSVIQEISQELSDYRDILNSISGIITLLKDMNTLTLDLHKEFDYNDIIYAISKDKQNLDTIKNAPHVTEDILGENNTKTSHDDFFIKKRLNSLKAELNNTYDLLGEWERKMTLSQNPKEIKLCDYEINNLKGIIEKFKIEYFNLNHGRENVD